jgi:hypothetical protein
MSSDLVIGRGSLRGLKRIDVVINKWSTAKTLKPNIGAASRWHRVDGMTGSWHQNEHRMSRISIDFVRDT